MRELYIDVVPCPIDEVRETSIGFRLNPTNLLMGILSMPSAAKWLMFKLTHLHPQVQLGVVVTLVLPPTNCCQQFAY